MGFVNAQERGALSIQFKLCTVINSATDLGAAADNTFFVQYEAEVLKPVLMDIGSPHDFGVSVTTAHTVVRLYETGIYSERPSSAPVSLSSYQPSSIDLQSVLQNHVPSCCREEIK